MPGKLPDDKVQISVVVDKEAAEKIQKLADMFGIPKSRMAKNLMYMGLDDAQLLSSLGITQTYAAVRNMRDIIKNMVKKGELT